VSISPDDRPALSRRAVLSLILVAAIAALVALPFLSQWGSSPERSPGSPAVAPVPPAFAGASAERVFFSPVDSAEAARRGLAPQGVRSVLATGGQLAYGGWRWDEAGVPAGALAIRVDLARQLVSVFRGPDEIGTAVIVYGVEGKDTPRGKLPILGKARDYHSITYDAPMPFSLWLRDDGVALHGSSVSMGKATNGCIGVPVEFAAKLFDVAKKGDIVEVVGEPVTS
jgi:lipoprotein-anchoring transpeptidase ErfK/SrfK